MEPKAVDNKSSTEQSWQYNKTVLKISGEHRGKQGWATDLPQPSQELSPSPMLQEQQTPKSYLGNWYLSALVQNSSLGSKLLPLAARTAAYS